jgi:RNA polymerase sigma-70 factor (ECF subfamily)
MEGSSQVDESLHRTVCACVSKLLATLSPEYAAALQAVELEGKKVGEFAKHAGITPNTLPFACTGLERPWASDSGRRAGPAPRTAASTAAACNTGGRRASARMNED